MSQSFISQKAYEDLLIFHVIYFNFIFIFSCKNKIKITHDKF